MLQHCSHFHVLIPLLEELQPLLLPPEGKPLQPQGLQRFKAYLQLVTDSLEALLLGSPPLNSQPVSRGPAVLTNMTAASAVVLQFAVWLCQPVPHDSLPQVTGGLEMLTASKDAC